MKRMAVILIICIPILNYAQDTIIMPLSGNGGFYNTCYAVIYDNGFESDYQNYSYSRITISPLWVQNVSLYFEEFNTEIYFDSLTLYDGPGISFPVIGSYSGNSLHGQTVSSTGNSITLEFRSDDIQTGSGFKARVSCLMGEDDWISGKLSIYPNPAENYLKVDGLEDDLIACIYIVDIYGKQIGSSVYSTELDVSFLQPGMYGLHIQLRNGQSIYKKWMKG